MIELAANPRDSRTRMRELLLPDSGEAEELEAEHGALAPHASPRRAAPQGATGEVDRLLHLERIPLEVCGLDLEGAEGIRQPARGEDRRIDRRREPPHSIEGRLDLAGQLLEHAARSGGVGVEQLPCKLEGHRRCGEILLHAVVQRLLDPPALPVEVGEHVERVGLRIGGGQHAVQTRPKGVASRGGGIAVANELILIVDDHEQNRRLARDVLQFAGFRTLEAAGGVEGLSLAAEHRPDLILMDIRMPDLNGTEAVRKLKEDERTASIHVVALTSSTMKGDRERFLADGFDGYLEKPIRVREFPDQIRRHLA
jgi:two-component system, cell cycle response regulator DivK